MNEAKNNSAEKLALSEVMVGITGAEDSRLSALAKDDKNSPTNIQISKRLGFFIA
jgi:hypothetical protein